MCRQSITPSQISPRKSEQIEIKTVCQRRDPKTGKLCRRPAKYRVEPEGINVCGTHAWHFRNVIKCRVEYIGPHRKPIKKTD